MNKFLQKALAILIITLGVTKSNAQNTWSYLNCIDSGSYVFDLFGVNDTLFYTVENNTIGRSYDGGKSWTRISNTYTPYSENYRYAYYQSKLFSVNTYINTLTRHTGTAWVADTAGLNGAKPANMWAFTDRMFVLAYKTTNAYLYTRTSSTSAWTLTTGIPTTTDESFKMIKQGNSYFGFSVLEKLWTSTNGTTFSKVNATGLPNDAVHFISHGTCMYLSISAASSPASLHKSCDNGVTWTQLNPFRYNNTDVGELFSDGTRLFLTEDIGVNPSIIYVSTNNAQTWVDITVPDSILMEHAISGFAKYKNVIIATQGYPDGGIKNCVKQYGTLTTGITEQANEVLLGSVYPNPATQYLTIELLRKANVKEIEIINIQGQRVMLAPVSSEFAAKSILVNIQDLPIGMYFVKVGNSMQKFVKQ
ncbi:MAG: T9SS type A sorting domain-containing protein [Bacteroidia bacterium]|nr:T9SS type A sorting domain-containing protein [Bacteroidia bacterium]